MSGREELAGQEAVGGLSGFMLYVERATFAIDPQYSEKSGSDTYFLNWEGPTNLPDRPVMVNAEGQFHPKWALDPDFVSMDGGKTVQSQSGNKSKVGKAYGRMCKQATMATEAYKDRADDPLTGVSALNAATWQGHTWLLENVDFDWGGEIGKRTELHPTQYIGAGNLTGATQTAQAPAAAPSPVAAAPVAPAPVAAPVDVLRDQVIAIAQGSADFTSFKGAALALPGVTDRTDLLIDISDATKMWSQTHPGS